MMFNLLERHRDKWVEDGDCYRWIGAAVGTARDRAQIWHKGRPRAVSRIMCEEAHGPPPTPKHQAAHDTLNGCIGGLCVNGEHLRWATHRENQQDMLPETRQDILTERWKGKRTYALPRWITFDKNLKKYKVVCGKAYLGYFVDLDDAIAARDKHLGVQ